MYKFMQDVKSLATGKSYKEGQLVPPGFNISKFLIDSGAIKKVREKKVKEKEDTGKE